MATSSPIEDMLADHLVPLASLYGWEMERNRRVGGYYPDFLIAADGVVVLVECDGHEFHDRTPEQAAHDRRRDRFFLTHSAPTLRFTGREIHESPDGYACEVVDVIQALISARKKAASGTR